MDEFLDAIRYIRQREWLRDVWKEEKRTCVYCGDWYQCDDHYIPCSWTGARYLDDNTVPSCSECNGLLGDHPIFTYSDRCRYLLPVYQKRARKYLRMPEWTEKELSELGYTLRTQIVASLALKEVYEQKLVNLRKGIHGKI